MEQTEAALDNVAHLHWADYLVIGIYFVGLLGIGYWVSHTILYFYPCECIMHIYSHRGKVKEIQ